MEHSFGNWIKHRRKALDLTQHELAKRVGCSISLIFKIESDERRPSRQIAELLARHLEIPLDQSELFLKVARQEKAVDRLESVSLLSLPQSISSPRQLQASLPVPLTSIIGREHELGAIIRQIQDPACRLLTLTGPGGVGKTRLALEVANSLREDFEYGTCFASLVGINAPEFIIPTVADQVGFAFSGSVELKTQLFNFLKEKQTLLILDNLEHLLNGIEVLDELLETAPRVKLLTTSREPLNLRAEWAFEVQGLPVPSNLEYENVESNSAAALFLQRARQIKVNFTPTPEDTRAIVKICQLVDGLPLGLELAAGWVRALSCREIAEEIEMNLDFLSATARDLPQRHRSMRAVFDSSWKLLSEEERQIMMRLSVFRGGFSREAAEQVAGAQLRILSPLMDRSLLRRNKDGRYHIHELIRQYSRDHLIRCGILEETCDLHLEYFLALAEQSRSKLRGPEQFTWFKLLEQDHDNLRAALEWSLRRDPAEFSGIDGVVVRRSLRLVSALYGFWAIRGHWSEGRNWLQRALAQSSGLPPTLEWVDARNAAALLAMNQTDSQAARQFAEENLALASEMEKPYTTAQAFLAFGTVLWKQNDYAAARDYGEQALARFRELGMKVEIAESLHILSLIVLDQGSLEVAQSYAKEGLAVASELEDQWMLSLIWSDMGNIEYLRKDLGAARSHFEKSQKLFREVGAMVAAAKIRSKLGDIARCEQDYAQAESCYRESLIVCREAGDKEAIAIVLHNLGYVANDHGDFPEASALFKEALAIHQETGNLAGVAGCLVGIAGVCLAQGHAERAAKLFGASEALRESVGASLGLANQIEYDRSLARLRSSLDQMALTAAWAAGRALTIEQAIREAVRPLV